MRRIRFVGACAIAAMAVFAISAMAASGASAGQYYWCQAQKKGEYTTSTCATKSAKPKKGKFEKVLVSSCVAQKKGEYTNSSCTTKSAKPKKGKFEISKGRKFTSTGGPAALATPALGAGEVKCKANTDEGEILNGTEDHDRVTFTGCEFEGLPCESGGPEGAPGGGSGIIKTNLLDSKLIDFPEEVVVHNPFTFAEETVGPAAGHVWNEVVSSEKQPYQAAFNCGGVVFLRTSGLDAGEYEASSTGSLLTVTKVEFKAGVGAGSGGLLTEVLTEEGWVPPGGAPSIEEAGTATITGETPIEVRAFNAPNKVKATPIAGGVGVKFAGKKCEFKFVGAKCLIEVKNESAAAYTFETGIVDKTGFHETPNFGENFRVAPGAPVPCNKVVIAAGATCKEEAELTSEPPPKFKATYVARAREGAVIKAKDTVELEAE